MVIKAASFIEVVDGHEIEYRYELAESGKWFQLMWADGVYCGDWMGRRCIYGLKTENPWVRDPLRAGGKIFLTSDMIKALRSAQAE